MPSLHLTELSVRALKGSDATTYYWDTTTPAFGVRVGKRAKTWTVIKGRRRERLAADLSAHDLVGHEEHGDVRLRAGVASRGSVHHSGRAHQEWSRSRHSTASARGTCTRYQAAGSIPAGATRGITHENKQ